MFPFTPPSPAKRVLIVDDSAPVREAVTTYVRRMGHEVHAAGDGPSAIALARKVRPDAALIDIWMPAMDGYQVGQRLRQELGAPLRMVAMTAFLPAESLGKWADAGFDQCLLKPIDARFLESWLGSRS